MASQQMPSRRKPSGSAAAVDTKATSIAGLRRAARTCRACPLWKNATQTVFGEGPERAKFILIGEQAGDREDREGLPFVGSAGRLLDEALTEIDVSRDSLYITNVIKHFKFELRGKRRLHKRANAAEINACMQWLDREIASIAPHYVVCLGALAARVMLGSSFGLLEGRGSWWPIAKDRWCLATVHPSFVLRSKIGGNYDAVYREFVADLAKMKRPPR